MTDTINIPHNKLVAWDGNVPNTNTDDITELAASICARGFLQSLVVRNGSAANTLDCDLLL